MRSELRLGKPQSFRMKFFYVYILQSESSVKHFYVGFTENLQDRLKAHNAGHVPHTIKFRLWRIKTAIAFTERQRAIEFERYLKTASGRAFAKKRLCIFRSPFRASLSRQNNVKADGPASGYDVTRQAIS